MSLSWIVLRASILIPWLGYLCWSDAKSRRLPNALTIGGLFVGLGVQAGFWGMSGLKDGFAAAGIGVLVLLVPFLLRGAGMGDVRLFAACGAFLGVREMPFFLMAVSVAGVVEALFMLLTRKATAQRLKHYFRSCFDWRYDRKAGKTMLPARDCERERVPYGIAIAIGCLVTVLCEFAMNWGR